MQNTPVNAATEQAVRRQKLADLQAAGHDPFTITKYPQDAFSADLQAEFKDLPAESETGKVVTLAGRLMSKRVMGKASFAHLRDAKGDIQIDPSYAVALTSDLIIIGEKSCPSSTMIWV